MKHLQRQFLTSLLGLALGLAGCANPALRQADELLAARQPGRALTVVDAALAQAPEDLALKAARQRVLDRATTDLLQQIDALRANARLTEAAPLLDRLQAIDAQHPRLAALRVEQARAQRHDAALAAARKALADGRADEAEVKLRLVRSESPGHPGLRGLQARLHELQARDTETISMGPAFQQPVTLEFRDAPLRSVFEALSRSAHVNFVFDREVRPDARITVYLRNTSIEEAIRVILGTNQLDRKLLSPDTVLVFPATAAKQREHQELVTRTLYLANADVKQAQALARTIAKVRDVFIDERLNMMVVRDTPEVVRMVEKLVAALDLAEPEVMLDVEVLEVATDRLDALGVQWPEEVSFGLTGVTGPVQLSQRDAFRASIVNPAVLLTLRGSSGSANLLANPKIRVRNREKAKVHIGEKLPVFTTTSTVNVGVSASVNYLDIGLKLDVEPLIGLDNDVTIRVAMEVSNLLRTVPGPSGSLAYQVGTRLTSTSLRLADGETQVISGLINDEDRRTAAGIPGLSSLPLLGALFGLNSTTRNKTEVVMLITPRILRNLSMPDASVTRMPGGTDASPGAFSTQIRPTPPSTKP